VEDQQSQTDQDFTEHLLDQAREALQDVADSASGAAQDAYDQGSRYVRQARERYPEAEQYIRKGQRIATHRATDNPLLALFTAGVAGYALAWLIHREKQDQEHHVPDHARTRRKYASSRGK
jgi:ElaB/YqjD/DUF883 family membrane-anchored ribosome-binding protein